MVFFMYGVVGGDEIAVDKCISSQLGLKWELDYLYIVIFILFVFPCCWWGILPYCSIYSGIIEFLSYVKWSSKVYMER